MATTSIEWTDKTWNPTSGCRAYSPGCANCYAVMMTRRLEAMGQSKYAGLLKILPDGSKGHFNGIVRPDEDSLTVPLGWKKPCRVFVNSMSDLFYGDEADRKACEAEGIAFEPVPFRFIANVFGIMQTAKQHTYHILTKRPERAAAFYEWFINEWLLKGDHEREYSHVWLGTSIENQRQADKRIPELLKCPAAVRFLSCEPLLGPVNLIAKCPPHFQSHLRSDRISWVIVGGESGPGARPCNIEWIRSIVQQCKAAKVPCFVKQLGAWIAGPHDFDGWKGLIDRWLLEHADGTKSTCTRPILRSDYCPEFYDQRPVNAVAWGLPNKKGGDIDEFPADLRVREFPKQETSNV